MPNRSTSLPLLAEEGRQKVLLADDDERSRRILGASLVAAGFEVWTAGDGAETLAAIENAPPDVAVLDYEMPGMNGAEICRRLRASDREAIRQLPVIMLTGHGGEAEEVNCLAAGANDFVTKPVGREVLIARIKTQLRLGSLSDALRAQNTELARWRAAQEADLDAARTTQQAIIASNPPPFEGWHVEVFYEPLIQVGGDVYGWRRLPDGRWLFWLADATGHGVAAALFTTLAALLFHHAALTATTAAEILGAVNAEFWSVFRGKSFMTACCAIIDQEGNLCCAGAGHPPILVRRKSGVIEKIASQGTMIGVFNTMTIPQAALRIEPGDIALLYTDGLFSLKGKDGTRFPPEAVDETLAGIPKERQILTHLRAALNERADGMDFDDDVAAMALHRG